MLSPQGCQDLKHQVKHPWSAKSIEEIALASPKLKITNLLVLNISSNVLHFQPLLEILGKSSRHILQSRSPKQVPQQMSPT